MIGSRLGGRYEILERVGGGGMAIVYKGLDNLLHRHVAVKVLRQQYVHDEEFIHRFRREAQAAASLSHPNVVSIYDVGQQDEIHYIVMEYIEGTTLNDLIKEKAPLQVEEAVHIAGQIADALDHAHHNQIIHRDIKPHNILIGRNGRVKVTDFGIARAVTSSTITQTGSVVGSVHYFSPEHAKGTTTGVQSDLYSLGIVMYQMLTGRLPFLGESPISVALKHLQEEVEEPRKVNPLIPQSVENIILKAMRKNTSERYRSAKDMLNDLDSCLLPHRRNEPKLDFLDEDELDEERTRVMPAIRPGQYETATETPEVRNSAEEEDEGAPVRKRRWVKPLVIFVVLIGVLAGMWYLVGYIKNMLVVPDVTVPQVVGLPVGEAEALLKEANLEVGIVPEPNDEVEKDYIIRRAPVDPTVKIHSKITLYVSEGPKKESMPLLVEEKLNAAKLKLVAMGVKEENIEVKHEHADKEPDTVLTQEPAEGEQIDPKRAIVKLVVSEGPEKFPMPDLVGMTEQEAVERIADAGLKLAKDAIVSEPSYSAPKGRVTLQFPYEAGAEVEPGAEITKLVVSSGLPREAGQMSVTMTVHPAVEGQPSKIEILLSDAQYDDHEYATLNNVTATRDTEVKLIVTPETDATIQVIVDGTLAEMRTVTYRDYLASKNPQPASSQPSGDPGHSNDQATPPDGNESGASGESPATPSETHPGADAEGHSTHTGGPDS